MNWEDWLRSAAERPSDSEDSKRDRTEQQIREALRSYKPLRDKPYRVYTKGSYANNTNVRLNFDVDVAVEYYGYFYSELAFELSGHDQSEVGVVNSTDSYERSDFKADILAALREAFGSTSVEEGRIAYRVREEKTTLPADVVPCWEYRRYDGIDRSGRPVVQIGSRVYPKNGAYANNFPKIQKDNGTAKNLRTSKRYKRMVRCLKKLQTRLVEQSLLNKELPSYLIECLVYNVPDDRFGNSTYYSDMRAVLAFLFNETLPNGNSWDWLEVHDLHYLFRGSASWTQGQVHKLADAAWNHVGFE